MMARNFLQRTATRQKQEGAVLVATLMILLVVTLLTVSNMRGSILEEKMAGNTNDRNVAFQAAESALREGEVFLESIVSLGDFQGQAGLFGRTDVEPSFYSGPTWNDSTYHVVAGTDVGTYARPQYFIKNMTTVPGVTGALNMSGYGDNKGSGDVTIFRVTVKATGTSADSAEVILRTQYGRIF
ncbi:MAG: PilX N-terminal domain-containing pilus assembly protein [Gammaproteobacteria bacterium]|nr:PilX N-terminal domain-containing pilus assembly protein [Gammaproteobacteria bacterium]MDH5617214.1 PilX N-terminal domain-containing pilus assembly protein [Gammaproteobacteria bacterium]